LPWTLTIVVRRIGLGIEQLELLGSVYSTTCVWRDRAVAWCRAKVALECALSIPVGLVKCCVTPSRLKSSARALQKFSTFCGAAGIPRCCGGLHPIGE
jgi:hypothetical protein